MRFFEEAFGDPKNWEENPPQPAIEDRVLDRPDPGKPKEIIEAQIVEPEGEPANDTPPRIAEMIKAGASPLRTTPMSARFHSRATRRLGSSSLR